MSGGISSNDMPTVVHLVHTAESPNLMNKEALPPKESMNSIRSPRFYSEKNEVLLVRRIVPLFPSMLSLCVHLWFRVVKYLTVDMLLGTLFIDRYSWRIFPSNRKFSPCHFQPLATILMQSIVNAISAEAKEADVHRIASRGSPAEEHHFRLRARQVRVPAYFQAVVLANRHSSGFMVIEGHRNVVGRRCSMTA